MTMGRHENGALKFTVGQTAVTGQHPPELLGMMGARLGENHALFGVDGEGTAQEEFSPGTMKTERLP